MTTTVVEVEMHAFGKRPDGSVPVRRVTVPAGEPATLDAVYRFGQNDFALPEDLTQRLPSVSVGDIIRANDLVLAPEPAPRYVVLPFGFRGVGAEFRPPADDRGGFYAYGLEEGGGR